MGSYVVAPLINGRTMVLLRNPLEQERPVQQLIRTHFLNFLALSPRLMELSEILFSDINLDQEYMLINLYPT